MNKKIIQSKEKELTAEDIQRRIGTQFTKFVLESGIPRKELFDTLFPAVRDATHLSKLMNEKAPITPFICYKLREAYGVDLNEFFGGKKTGVYISREVKTALKTLTDFISDLENSMLDSES